MSNEQIGAVTPLNSTRWDNARLAAIEAIRRRDPAPQVEDFRQQTYSRLPGWTIVLIVTGLVVLAMVAFYVSAGKLIIAADGTLSPLITVSNRLSGGYIDGAIIVSLFFGEIGSLLFAVCASVLPGSAIVIRGQKVHPVKWTFRATAFVCGLVAILGNVAATLLHAPVAAPLEWYSWCITIGAPGIVLIVGLVIERLAVETLEARARCEHQFAIASAEWKTRQGDPALHPEFKAAWYAAILDQLERVSARNRKLIADLVESHPMIRAELVQRELNRHQWTLIIQDESHPFLTEPTSPDSVIPESGAVGSESSI